MADLATISDVNARSPRTLTAGEQTRATTLLGDASARIRTYTKRQFAAVTNATVTLRPVGAFLELPPAPAIEVHEVRGINIDGTPGDPLTGWAFDGVDRIDITRVGFSWSADPWWPWSDGPESFQILYDYDEAPVPGDVVRICCGMVLRAILSPSATEGMNTERVGQYSYGMQQNSAGAAGPTVRLTEQDKQELREAGYGPRPARSVQVRL